ncbi:Fur family transcriptional regulator, ferric uptake regulator [Caloramator quimbayensis]|uniref:Fur family transcriptional regulator, ferric uptake regulator n=1 Tax=Caloramator quimbayensis TaxID=1147123 RepID=A0A1T4WXZ4_9CLOT|nr:transcriptional repressor [Caloramator quimbayensis]SKA81481.1 Fur family transcriptional regulator, ferric uptake regulator [Caloramator quimbayensis]
MKDKDINQMFLSIGIKNTKHRRDIIKILDASNKPLSVEEIYLLLKENNSSINLSTVYRTMEKLIEKNIIIQNNPFNDNIYRYQMCKDKHRHHIVCIKCSKIVEIEECPFKDFEDKIKKETGFDIENHKFEIYGYCNNCKKNKE